MLQPRSTSKTHHRRRKARSASCLSFSYGTLGGFTRFGNDSKPEIGKLTSYNANGAFLAGTSTTNQAVKHTYTPRGQLATTSVAVNGINQTTTYTYDAIGQSKQVTYHFGRSIKLANNANKQLVKITDPLGQSVQHASCLGGR